LIFQTEKQIKEFGDKLTESDKIDLNLMVEKLKESHKNQDLINIEKYTKSLTETWNRISVRLYEQAQEHQTNTSQEKDENISDVDFEEVKE